MTYEEAQDYIASLAPRGWRLGLDRMQAFVDKIGLQDALGAPTGPQFIHVAGTNGKGSVTTYLQSILIEAGYKTGSFFSPFVYDPRERVQFGKEYISKEDLAKLTEELIPIAESFSETEFGGITEFEFKAALGFLYWKRKQCEWVALEVGLGGRLDATNVVTPKASIIVSIGLDHTNILGHTLAEIAYEKAGVIKPGVPVIVGEMSADALEVIERVARDTNAPLWLSGRDVSVDASGDVRTPIRKHEYVVPGIRGFMQDQNMSLAIAALDAVGMNLADGAFTRGSRLAYAPGRFEYVKHNGKKLVLDGAHNPDAARVLVHSLQSFLHDGQKLILVSGMVAGHEPSVFYKEIGPLIKSAHVVPIDFHRALPASEVAAALRGLVPQVAVHDSVAQGIAAAEAEAGKDDLILVTGSFYLVGDVGRFLNLPNRDL
jgi:dihydrofolate synthase/folylpolyglutamate synthase